MTGSFYERVYELVRQVPCGRVVTYGQIARALGAPRAARSVGWAIGACPKDVPWHRVVNAKGQVSKRVHAWGESLQKDLLEAEGVELGLDDHVELRVYGWDGF